MSKPDPLYKIDLAEGGLISQDGQTVLVNLPPGHKLHVSAPRGQRLAIYPMIPRGATEAQEAIVDLETSGIPQRSFELLQVVPKDLPEGRVILHVERHPDFGVLVRYKKPRPWWKFWARG